MKILKRKKRKEKKELLLEYVESGDFFNALFFFKNSNDEKSQNPFFLL
jgi:hypothetical protein